MKKVFLALLVLSSFSASAGADQTKRNTIECAELGAQAELSISINPKSLTAKFNFGEEISKTIKLKKLESDGSIANYLFKYNNTVYNLTIVSELVSQEIADAENDDRNYSVLTYGKSGFENSTAMGCQLTE
jgi:hypothetical protein